MGYKLPDIDEELYSCLQCGYCRNICPTFEQFGWESASPRGKIYYLKQLRNAGFMDKLLKRNISLNEYFAERIYHCTSCDVCSQVCHVDIEINHMWEKVKTWLVQQGMGPRPVHQKLYKGIKAKHNPFGEEPETRCAWLPEEFEIKPQADVVFFAGCTEAYRMMHIAKLATRLLAKAGVDFTVLGPDEWCCGSPLLRTGQVDIVEKEIVQHNVKAIQDRGAKVVISACSGCYGTISHDYPRILGHDLPFELYHLSQFAEKLIREGLLELENPINKKVTYHDPCHLGRHGHVYDAPREVLKLLPGVEFVEMKRNKNMARCCGAGAGFKAQYNDYAEKIATGRAQEALATGCEMLSTCCPFCNLNMRAGFKHAGVPDMAVKDVVELVAQAAGVKL